jgi:hypothetical protein
LADGDETPDGVNYVGIKGVLTIEDVLEELINEDIVDETHPSPPRTTTASASRRGSGWSEKTSEGSPRATSRGFVRVSREEGGGDGLGAVGASEFGRAEGGEYASGETFRGQLRFRDSLSRLLADANQHQAVVNPRIESVVADRELESPASRSRSALLPSESPAARHRSQSETLLKSTFELKCRPSHSSSFDVKRVENRDGRGTERSTSPEKKTAILTTPRVHSSLRAVRKLLKRDISRDIVRSSHRSDSKKFMFSDGKTREFAHRKLRTSSIPIELSSKQEGGYRSKRGVISAASRKQRSLSLGCQ